jgi:hypothetical protein
MTACDVMMWIRMWRPEKKFETIWNVTSCDVIHVGTSEQKNFECYQGDITFQLTLSKRCNVHAMSMPWNVIKVTLHSSSHYPSDAMSMQCPCHGMLSSWHYILAHITQAMQCPCNVHGMECCQGDITHGIQCPCYGMWSRWQHSRWHYPRDAMSFCRQMTSHGTIPRTPFHTNDRPTTPTWPIQSLHVYAACRENHNN